ncbi:THIOREDOXIN [Salix koriyanagi]|uniref:THIOREDOXIN n=1 Tax=Salix koriyanagi TaxID=2511006 RepID=A0A9Q0P3S3_9ROSI|nr:THIOREDOXIN [Salix koriyanagi]
MAGEGQVIVCQTEESWNQQLEKGKESNKLIVVDFTASWCGPCKLIFPAVEELAWKLPNVTFLKVDVDELQSVAQGVGCAGNADFHFPERWENCGEIFRCQ